MNISREKLIRAEPWLACIMIILAASVTYGILITRLGFYRDDWYMLWSGQSKDGLTAIIRLFQTDRPLIGWTYASIYKVIGANVLAWQILALLLKICTGLFVFFLLRMIWPEKRLETSTAALLFVLYPGFYQQPVAATFSIDLLGLNTIFLSLLLTVLTFKTSNKFLQIFYTLLAMILGLLNLGLYEATIGLEVIRWALIWVFTQQKKSAPPNIEKIASKQQKKNILHVFSKKLFAYLGPYLFMLAGYLYWRLFIFKSIRRATNIEVLLSDYANNPLYSLAQIIFGYIKDLFETVILAWFVPFYQFTGEGRFNNFLSALGVSAIVIAIAGVYFYLFHESAPQANTSSNSNRQFIWMGLIGVLIPSAVIVLLGRNVVFSTQWDRYTTQSMLGVGILISGFIYFYLRGYFRWGILFGLIFLAVMTHYHSAAVYSRFWEFERNLVWQLSWRAPGLQPETTLIVSMPEGYRLAEEYEIWGPVNIAYFPKQAVQVSGQVPTDEMILDLKAKTIEKRTVRNVNIRRDYGKPLIISMPGVNSCFHILDGQNPTLPFFESGRIKEIAKFSNIQLIDTTTKPVTPPVNTFGGEPDHGWCYYYQSIQLALQTNNTALAAALSDKAKEKGLLPSDETEWMPVIFAYTLTSQTEKATQTAEQIDKDLRKYICLQHPQLEESQENSPTNSFYTFFCSIK